MVGEINTFVERVELAIALSLAIVSLYDIEAGIYFFDMCVNFAEFFLAHCEILLRLAKDGAHANKADEACRYCYERHHPVRNKHHNYDTDHQGYFTNDC